MADKHITDLHLHTAISYDGKSPAEAYILKAIERHDKKIGFSEHYDYDRFLDDPTCKIEDLDGYSDQIKRLRDKYSGKIEIFFGIELGYDPRNLERNAEVAQKYNFDYIINSTHNINGKDCYLNFHSETLSKHDAYSIYLNNLLNSLDVDYPYDIIGHVGYPSRYSSYPDKLLRYEEFPDLLDEILLKIIKKNKYLELNTSTKGVADFLPEPHIVKRYIELGGKLFTFGSDAHSVDRYKENCETVELFLNRHGFSLSDSTL